MIALAMIFSTAEINKRLSAVNIVTVVRVGNNFKVKRVGIPLSEVFRYAMDFRPLSMPAKIIEKIFESWRQISLTYWWETKRGSITSLTRDKKCVCAEAPCEVVMVTPHEKIGEGELGGDRWAGAKI